MIERILLAAAGIAAASLASPAEAEIRVLDFAQGDHCPGGRLCTNNGAIDQSYGDAADLDINYFSIVGAGPRPRRP